MKLCPSCRSANRSNAKYCRVCGASLESVASCPYCGSKNRAQARYCLACGTPLLPSPTRTLDIGQLAPAGAQEATVHCPSCGVPNRPGAKFCSQCGYPLSKRSIYEPPTPVYEPPTPVYEPPAPVYEPPAPVYKPPAPTYEPPIPQSALPPTIVLETETGPLGRLSGAIRKIFKRGIDEENFAGYELVREIGRGGMGIAYLAEEVQEEEDKKKVVKLLLPELQKQPLLVSLFEDSARVQQSLQHPNIAPILTVGREQNTSFIVQPYYANGPLDRWFRYIDLNIVIQVFRQVCRAVQFAHERGEIHGDIKPSNVLIGSDGQALLTDFMSSKALSQVLTSSGIRWGTPIYMAPEILVSVRLPDVKTDIYTLGLLLFEAVKGYLPRQLNEREALAGRIQTELPLAVDPKYSWINNIIEKATHPDPSQRFNNVRDIIAAIQEPRIEYEWPHYVSTHAMAWLEFEDGRPRKDLGKATYSIGSNKHRDIGIRIPGTSGRYAEIDFRDGTFLIRRVSESGKLYLNGEQIRVARVLHRGDQIRIGNFQIRFVLSKVSCTQQLGKIRILPIAWLRMLGEGNEEGWTEIIEDPVRIIDEGNAYAEIRPVAGKLRLLTSGLIDSVLVNQVPTDKIDLFEGDIIEWGDTRWSIHYARDEWMEVIDKNLLKHGEVSEHDLFELPPSCRLIAMREYAVERSYLDISFSVDAVSLRCNDMERLQLFRQLWADSRDTFDRRIGVEVAAELVELIKEKLFVSEPGSQGDRLGSRYGGFMVFPLDISSLVQGLNLPQCVPLILAKCIRFSSDDFSNLLQAVKSLTLAPRLATIIFLDETSRFFVLDAIQQLRQGHAIDVLDLGREDVQRILFARDPRRNLRTGLLSNINLVEVSPFVITGPTYRRIFFGRERELREVTTKVDQASFALISGRRFGKTSLLLRLYKDRLPAADFRTLYYDCSTTPTYDAFLAAKIRDYWRPEPPSNAPATFNDLLQSPSDNKSLVLLLDEADKLVPADRANGWPLFNALRALANSGRAQVVLSGACTLRAALRDSSSPLFNFANEMLLGPLDYRAVEELVTRPMKQIEIELVDEKAIVDRIWAFTSGHPNVVQRLCRRLIIRLNEQGTRRITLDDVTAVIENPGFQRDDFLSVYWEAAAPLEKIISLLMVDDEDVRTLSAVRQALADHCNLLPKAHEVDDALQRLVDLRSILARTPCGYTFALKSFPGVVAGTMTLRDMLEILKEDYTRNEA